MIEGMPPIKIIPRPQPLEILEWTGDNEAEIRAFVGESMTVSIGEDNALMVNDGTGSVTIPVGGYVMYGSVFSNPIENYQTLTGDGPFAFEVTSD
jgi:hypothetical protein